MIISAWLEELEETISLEKNPPRSVISPDIFDHGQTAAIPLKYLIEEECCDQVYFQSYYKFLGWDQVQTQGRFVPASHIIIIPLTGTTQIFDF